MKVEYMENGNISLEEAASKKVVSTSFMEEAFIF